MLYFCLFVALDLGGSEAPSHQEHRPLWPQTWKCITLFRLRLSTGKPDSPIRFIFNPWRSSFFVDLQNPSKTWNWTK